MTDDKIDIELFERDRRSTNTESHPNLHATLMSRLLPEHERLADQARRAEAAKVNDITSKVSAWLEGAIEKFKRSTYATAPWFSVETLSFQTATAAADIMSLSNRGDDYAEFPATGLDLDDVEADVDVRLELVDESGEEAIKVRLELLERDLTTWTLELVGMGFDDIMEPTLITHQITLDAYTEDELLEGARELGFKPSRLMFAKLRQRA